MSSHIAEGQIQIHRGLSTEVLAEFDDHTLDWVYIDTNHSYATTAAELDLSAAKVRTGGIIAGHDFLHSNWSSGLKYGVVEAVHEFCVTRNWEFIGLTNELNQFRSFAIRETAPAQ
jgi:hypothetical protein